MRARARFAGVEMTTGGQAVENARGDDRRVRHLERYHVDSQTALEDYFRRFGIALNVELRSSAGVAVADGAAHAKNYGSTFVGK